MREPLRAGLDKYGETLLNVLRQSNFDLAMSEFLMDLAAGTACMMMTAKPEKGLNFEAVPSYLVALEAGAHGKVDTVYRKLRLKGEAIMQQWPDAQIDADLAKEIEEKPTEEINLVEATIYRPEENYYCYHLIEPEKKREIVYRETVSSSWIITRYMVVAGEVTGRGPLLSALPDIKSITVTQTIILQNASLAVAGI
mgnify:FL=1